MLFVKSAFLFWFIIPVEQKIHPVKSSLLSLFVLGKLEDNPCNEKPQVNGLNIYGVSIIQHICCFLRVSSRDPQLFANIHAPFHLSQLGLDYVAYTRAFLLPVTFENMLKVKVLLLPCPLPTLKSFSNIA